MFIDITKEDLGIIIEALISDGGQAEMELVRKINDLGLI